MSVMNVFVASVLFVFTLCSPPAHARCTISYPKPGDLRQPLVVLRTDSGWQFPLITNGNIVILGHEEIRLLCAGNRNALIQGSGRFVTATCIADERLRVEDREYEFRDLQCIEPVSGSIRQTTASCGNNKGNIIQIGFDVTDADWKSLIDVCYDSELSNTLYSEHILFGQSIYSATRQKHRPFFNEDGLARGISANQAFKSQNASFATILGFVPPYISKQLFINRGHFAPNGDFLYPGLQFSTYFYINTCPQWVTVNGGIWSRLENFVRRLAHTYSEPFRIITGGHGILELENVDGVPQEMFLHRNYKMPVPKYLWKIVYSDLQQKGIALITLNHPSARNPTLEDVLCDDICNLHGWPTYRSQYYCCDIRELRRNIPEVPSLQVRGVLDGKGLE